MANKGGTTVDAGSVTQDSSYTYLGIPSSGYYSSGSKVRAKNSDLKRYASGSLTSTNGERSIECGFRPDIIVCVQTSGSAAFVFDVNRSSSTFYYISGTEAHGYKTIGTYAYGIRANIDTGFIIKNKTSGKSWDWFAVKL